jgi:multidrug efflux pump subunit AcrA (membrane-fusion protein)
MKRLGVVVILILVLAVVGLVVASGIIPRLHQQEALKKETLIAAEPTVTVTRPKPGNPAEEVILPGNIQAFIDAPIYARASGYLKTWYFDIGARVKQGQLLAVIESPEVDQQLQQAREDLGTAQANLKLSEITASRYVDLFRTDSFEKIYTPFDGVVTARNTDIGQLIQAGNAAGGTGSTTGAGKELFHVAAVKELRVFVQVPQVYSHATRPGIKADLTVPELPGRRFQGTLVRTADAMDPATRTLMVEVDVVNSAGLLYPGAYAQVHFKIKSDQLTLIVPASSLVFRSEGLRLPVVVSGQRISLLPVVVGRDFGDTVEVLSGLSENASIVENPPDSLVEGEIVRVVRARSSPSAAAEAP